MADEIEVQENETVSIDTLPMADYKKARSEGVLTIEKPAEKTEEDEEVKPDAEKQDEKPKSKGGFQKRIDRLVKHNATLEAERESDKKRIAELEAATSGKETVQADPAKFPGFTEWSKAQVEAGKSGELENYMDARDAWKEQKEEEAASQAERREVFDAYNQKVSEAQAKYDDWKEVVGQSIDLPKGVGPAIIEMENGPDVAYYLGKHPEMCEELLQMGSLRAIGKVWRISEELAGEQEKEAKPEEKEEKQEKLASKAPAPIKPVGGGSTKSSVPLDQLNMAEYKKARAAGRVH